MQPRSINVHIVHKGQRLDSVSRVVGIVSLLRSLASDCSTRVSFLCMYLLFTGLSMFRPFSWICACNSPFGGSIEVSLSGESGFHRSTLVLVVFLGRSQDIIGSGCSWFFHSFGVFFSFAFFFRWDSHAFHGGSRPRSDPFAPLRRSRIVRFGQFPAFGSSFLRRVRCVSFPPFRILSFHASFPFFRHLRCRRASVRLPRTWHGFLLHVILVVFSVFVQQGERIGVGHGGVRSQPTDVHNLTHTTWMGLSSRPPSFPFASHPSFRKGTWVPFPPASFPFQGRPVRPGWDPPFHIHLTGAEERREKGGTRRSAAAILFRRTYAPFLGGREAVVGSRWEKDRSIPLEKGTVERENRR